MNAADFIRQRLAEIRVRRHESHGRWHSKCGCCADLPALAAALEAALREDVLDDVMVDVARALGWREEA